MLKDEKPEIIEQQFYEKNSTLEAFGEPVTPFTMYEDIFGDLETEIPVVIIDDDEVTKHIEVMPVADAVTLGECRNDVLIGGCTYINNWISKKSARDICAFIVDLDNVYYAVLQEALINDWKRANGEPLPKPTYIVNSGTGLHLYFVLSEPLPNYHKQTANIDKLYRKLAGVQAQRIFIRKDVQWFGQSFRCAGGLNKYGWTNSAYRVGDKWDVDELAQACGLDLHFIRYGQPRKEPEATTAAGEPLPKGKKKAAGWKVSRAFYDYALKTCAEQTKEGRRYLSMCALTVIAYKCGVPQDELKAGLMGLLPVYNKGANRQIKPKEVYSAMKMYNDKAAITPRAILEK